ncbi:hypothetical protein GCM10023322_75340 [Rugosimonospora acidiphila]|uniref:Uncharacterized protein n=1 Tax=Rugosimonospora acidiphila TaxID=556531 RepID=A0ABP9SR10_9ACTN
MVFGRGGKKRDESPVELVSWQDAPNFSITTLERPETLKRRRKTFGARAVRVRRGDKDFPVNAPCAFFAPADGVHLPVSHELTLFEDEACQRLLCYVEASQQVDGERRHVVRDGGHETIGVVRRIPPRRPFRHTWRIDQPGHPEIVGRNEWASGGPSKAQLLVTTAVRVGFNIIDSAGSENGEGRGNAARILEWWSGEDEVMRSVGSDEFRLYKDWFDRRLAFAFALIRDR